MLGLGSMAISHLNNASDLQNMMPSLLLIWGGGGGLQAVFASY